MEDTAFKLIEHPKANDLARKGFPDSVRKAMKQTLKSYTSDDWESDNWDVYVPTSQRRIVIRFPAISPINSDILKATALMLLIETGSVEAAQRVAREGGYFMKYLLQQGIHVEETRTSSVNAYIKYMNDKEVSEAVIASRVRSAKAVFDTCIENGLVTTNCKVVFEYKYKATTMPRIPPDICVIDEIDRLMFNLPDDEVPLIMRTLYLVVRMIPSRISEILSMGIDCLRYPEKGLFSLSKPTFKETALHMPVLKEFVFSLEGKAEGLLHRSICELIAVNRAGDSLTEDADYLFYDKDQGCVLSADDFNAFLAHLVSKHKLRNEDGSYPKVTSHTYRHITIGERLRSGIYSVEETAEEAGHTNPNVTLGYGYQSKNDEAKRLRKIVEEVMQNGLGSHFDRETKQRILNEVKFARLRDNMPFLRLIPIIGACDDKSCIPQYAECINCDDFEPDSIYLDYFLEERKNILKRLERLYKGGAEEAIAFEEYELELMEKYIRKMDSSIIFDDGRQKGDSFIEQQECNSAS